MTKKRKTNFYKTKAEEKELNLDGLSERDKKIIQHLKKELVDRTLISPGSILGKKFVANYAFNELEFVINKFMRNIDEK